MGEELDNKFLHLATKVSEKATCNRLRVGSVIVVKGEIVSTGYNDSPEKEVKCLDEGCLMYKGNCIRTIHAEMNAILKSVKKGVPLKDAEIYVTHYPCYNCAKHIVQVGITKVSYINDYRNSEKTEQIFKNNGVKVVKVD